MNLLKLNPRKNLIFQLFDEMSSFNSILFLQTNNLESTHVKKLREDLKRAEMSSSFIKNTLFGGWARKQKAIIWKNIGKLLAGQTLVVYGNKKVAELKVATELLAKYPKIFFIAAKIDEDAFAAEALDQMYALESRENQMMIMTSLLDSSTNSLSNILTKSNVNLPMLLNSENKPKEN